MAKIGRKDHIFSLRYHLYDIFAERGDWAKKRIPVSYIDPTSGLLLEGYILTPPKKDRPVIQGKEGEEKVSTYLDSTTLKVYPAFLPIYSESTIEISIKDIYPSNRMFNKLDYNSLEIIKTKAISVHEDTVLFDKKDLPEFIQVFKYYSEITWTIDELEKMSKNTREEIENKMRLGDLVPKDEKNCLIDGELKPTYTTSMPVSDHKIVTTVEDLKAQYSDCTLCNLGVVRQQRSCPVVFGKGKVYKPQLFIIGEAPGLQEEENNSPFFSGAPAGGALEKVLKKAGFDPKECYYTNAVLCRPEPEDPKFQNGKPKFNEIAACNSRLKNLIHIVSPYKIVVLGNFAYKAFFGKEAIGGILKNIGWHDKNNPYYKIYAMEHPAYIVRKVSSLRSRSEAIDMKRRYLEQWKEVARG